MGWICDITTTLGVPKKGSSHVKTGSEQILRMEELAGWEEPPAGRLEAEFWSSPEEQVVLDREFFLRLHFLQALFFSLRIGGGSGVWFSGEVIVLKCKAKGLSPSTERKKKKVWCLSQSWWYTITAQAFWKSTWRTTLEHAVRFHRELEANLSTA